MLSLAFLMLGFLIGNLVGLTAQSVVTALLPLLLAFGGGSAVGFLKKLGPDERTSASKAVVALSLSCLIGTYCGILVSEHQWLTPQEVRQARLTQSIAETKYLRAYATSEVAQIDQLYRAGRLSPEQAYDQLYQLLKAKGAKE